MKVGLPILAPLVELTMHSTYDDGPGYFGTVKLMAHSVYK